MCLRVCVCVCVCVHVRVGTASNSAGGSLAADLRELARPVTTSAPTRSAGHPLNRNVNHTAYVESI
jgi:hypothetical protein